MRTLAGLIATMASLVLCPAAFGSYLYVANSTAPGTISQFSVKPDGTLAPLSPPTVPTVASGTGATGIDVSPDGKNVIAGNFTAGNVVRFTVNPNGTLSSAPVQTIPVPAAQQVRYSPDGLSAYAPRASNPGFIAQFSVAADGTLTAKSPALVSGQITPGPLAFNAAGTRAYSGQNGGTGVAQFAVAGDATLSPLTPPFVTTSPGGSQARVVALSPDGTSLYAPQSGSSNVAQFAVNADGTLTFVATYPAGSQPRGVAITPDGTSVYAANSTNDATTGNSISQYTRAPDGALTPKSPATVPSGSISPGAIELSRDGRSAYVTNQGADKVSQFTVQADGRLTPKTPLLVTAAPGANQLVFSDGPPPLAPAAVTGAASSVTTASASLSATVDPNGHLATYVFESGTTPAFGSITPADDAGTGFGAVTVAGSLTGLAANTTYYYRAVATSSAGTTFGAVRSFRTAGPAQPPLAVTLPAAAIGTSSADLAGQVNPSGLATAFTFEYGASLAFGQITPVVALDDADALEPVSASLTGLAPDTTYYYRVVATSAGGTATGTVLSFSTGPGGAPIVATGVASAVTASSATLAGTVDAHGSATAFAFEYGLSNAFGSLSAVDSAGASNGAQAVSLPLGGLAPGTTYRYRLVATNAFGTVTGAVMTFTTPASRRGAGRVGRGA